MSENTNQLEVVGALPSFRRSAEAEALIKRMTEAAEGEVITFLEMHEITGIPPAGRMRLRGVMETARRQALKEGRVFGAVGGVGIKLLAPAEVVDCESATIGHTHRRMKRSGRKLATVDAKRLDAHKRAELTARTVTIHLMAHVSSREGINQVKQLALKDAKTFTPTQAVEMLKAAGL